MSNSAAEEAATLDTVTKSTRPGNVFPIFFQTGLCLYFDEHVASVSLGSLKLAKEMESEMVFYCCNPSGELSLTFASFSLRCLDVVHAQHQSHPLIQWDESAATL